MRRRLSRAGERGVAKAIALPVLLLIGLAGYAGHQAPRRQDKIATRDLSESRWTLPWWCCTLR